MYVGKAIQLPPKMCEGLHEGLLATGTLALRNIPGRSLFERLFHQLSAQPTDGRSDRNARQECVTDLDRQQVS